VVIFPCDVDVYRQINPKVWLDQLPEEFEKFNELLVSYNKDLSLVNKRGMSIYNQQREEMELDNFNLLYVALTRAVEQLHIITEYKISSKGEENTNFYSGVFINYLKEIKLWNDEVLEYEFGERNRCSTLKNNKTITETQESFISKPWKDHNLILLASSSKLWNTAQEKAIEYGNLLHEIFAKIQTKENTDKVLFKYYQQGILDDKEFKIISKNEREIATTENQIIIPDRLVLIDHKFTIIDYKTGSPSQKHQQQLSKYESVLLSMNYKVDKKILIYINDKIKVLEV
jgi:ATP-dependent exoDNAse (exonuclease V) beta subunit